MPPLQNRCQYCTAQSAHTRAHTFHTHTLRTHTYCCCLCVPSDVWNDAFGCVAGIGQEAGQIAEHRAGKSVPVCSPGVVRGWHAPVQMCACCSACPRVLHGNPRHCYGGRRAQYTVSQQGATCGACQVVVCASVEPVSWRGLRRQACILSRARKPRSLMPLTCSDHRVRVSVACHRNV